MIKRASGFTLVEMLVVLGIIGVLLAVGAVSLQGYRQRLLLQNDAMNAVSTVKYALDTVRKDNRGVTLQITGATLLVKRGTATLRTVALENTPTVTCNGTCPTGNTFTFAAPYGRSTQDFALAFRRAGMPERKLWVRGPAALVRLQ